MKLTISGNELADLMSDDGQLKMMELRELVVMKMKKELLGEIDG